MMSDFNQIFSQLDAPDYPATCDICGAEGTNAVMQTHSCSKSTADYDHREETTQLHYLIGESPEGAID